MQFLNVKKAGSFDISVCPSKEYYYVDISLTRFDMQTLRSARCVLTHSICAARVTQKSPEKSRGDGGVWGGNRGSLLRTREQWGFPYGGRGAPNVRFAHTIRRASDTDFYYLFFLIYSLFFKSGRSMIAPTFICFSRAINDRPYIHLFFAGDH